MVKESRYSLMEPVLTEIMSEEKNRGKVFSNLMMDLFIEEGFCKTR